MAAHAWTIGLLLAALSAVSAALAWLLTREMNRRVAFERELAELATTDSLTGLSNRRHFDNAIRLESQRAQRAQAPLSLLMIDLDHFKAYNDRHGHQAGDQLLGTIGAAISHSVRRGTDIGARYGGDEFAVLLPDTPLSGAARIAEQIRSEFVADGADAGDAQISIGVACLTPENPADHTKLLNDADFALYRAKELGRNRIELAEPEPAALDQAA
jgi:diguanylate cyclase (GGDEF)-like protein